MIPKTQYFKCSKYFRVVWNPNKLSTINISGVCKYVPINPLNTIYPQLSATSTGRAMEITYRKTNRYLPIRVFDNRDDYE